MASQTVNCVYDVIQFDDDVWGERFQEAQKSAQGQKNWEIDLQSKPPTLSFMGSKFVGTIFDSSDTQDDNFSNVILSEKRDEKMQIFGISNRVIEFHEVD